MPSDEDAREDGDARGALARAVRRAETAEIRRDVNRLEERVDEHDSAITDLRVDGARRDGQIAHLAGAYDRAANLVAQRAADDLELDKARQLAAIRQGEKDAEMKREVRKQLIFKLLAIGMGIWAIVSAALAHKC